MMQKYKNGVMSLFLCKYKICLCACLLSLIACSQKTEFVQTSEIIEIKPSAHLMQHTEEPIWTGQTNEDLIQYIFELKEALARCNADKKGLRGF